MKIGKRSYFLWIIIAFTLPLSARATVRNVPAQYSTIQAGINAAVNGDTVLVAPGIYTGIIIDAGVNGISLVGSQGTIIQGNNSIGIDLTYVSNWLIKSIEITGCLGSGLSLDHCSNITVEGCHSHHNAENSCRGFYAVDCANVIFRYNVANHNLGNWGVGFWITGTTNCLIENNTSVSNRYDGIIFTDGCIIKNNIIVNNSDHGIEYWGGAAPGAITYNDCWNNRTNYGGCASSVGGISASPLFQDTLLLDYRLTSQSPCVNTGDPVSHHDPDGSRADIGAYYYYQHLRSLWNISTSGCDSSGDGSFLNPFRTIQHGINAAIDGDTVFVSGGHYYERIKFLGKAITVASEYLFEKDSAHILNTIIDADTSILGVADTGCVVRFVNEEDLTSIIYGFTIQKGTVQGGLLSANSEASIKNCRFINNSIGILVSASYPHIDSCTFDSGQDVMYSGLGNILSLRNSTFNNADVGYWRNKNIYNCKFYGSDLGGSYNGITMTADTLINSNITIVDGGIINDCCFKQSTLYAVNDYLGINSSYIDNGINAGGSVGCEVSIKKSLLKGDIGSLSRQPYMVTIDSSTLVNGRIFMQAYSNNRVTINNSLITTQNNPYITFVNVYGNPQVHISCSDFFGCVDSNWISGTPISLDTNHVYFQNPLFCDTASGNYNLLNTSVCLPSNNGCSTLIGLYGQGCELALDPFSLLSPSSLSVHPNVPSFMWSRSIDNYYGNQASYRFFLDDNPEFASPESSDILLDTSYIYTGSLSTSTCYYCV